MKLCRFLLICWFSSLPWSAAAEESRSLPMPPTSPLPSAVGGLVEFSFQEDSVELDAGSKLKLMALAKRIRAVHGGGVVDALLHTAHEEVVSTIPSVERDRARIAAVKQHWKELTGKELRLRAAPLRPLGDTASRSDGTVRIVWRGGCGHDQSRAACLAAANET